MSPLPLYTGVETLALVKDFDNLSKRIAAKKIDLKVNSIKDGRLQGI